MRNGVFELVLVAFVSYVVSLLACMVVITVFFHWIRPQVEVSMVGAIILTLVIIWFLHEYRILRI